MTTFLEDQKVEFKEFSNTVRAVDSYGKATAAMISQAVPGVYRFNPASFSVVRDSYNKDKASSETPNDAGGSDAQDISDTVKANKTAALTMLYSQAVSDRYKTVSEDLIKGSVKKKIKKKSMKQLMQQSVFHGRSWMGENFIA